MSGKPVKVQLSSSTPLQKKSPNQPNTIDRVEQTHTKASSENVFTAIERI